MENLEGMYYVRVSAVNEVGKGPASNVVEVVFKKMAGKFLFIFLRMADVSYDLKNLFINMLNTYGTGEGFCSFLIKLLISSEDPPE
jgi:hypothetical protein